jgi:hypothetical protein
MNGRINPRMLLFMALVVVVVGGLYSYTLRRQPPTLPPDRDHRLGATPDICLSCHGPGAVNARGANHPLNDQCFNCHERA